jgi:exosortase/archaeosortase family protein
MLYRTNDLFISTGLVHGANDEVEIILSCTALPSMLLFLAAILCSSASVREKLRTGLLLLGLIHILNVIRVSLFTFLIYEGYIDDYFAHAVAGKIGSIIILLLLVILLFRRIPEIRDYISRLFILNRRRKPDSSPPETAIPESLAQETAPAESAAPEQTPAPESVTSEQTAAPMTEKD